MKDFKGTKGKWEVNHSESKTAYNVIGTALGHKYKIARCPYDKCFGSKDKQETKANAQLIATAPELLNAAQNVFEMLSFNKGEEIPEDAWNNTVDNLGELINKALGKEEIHE